MLLVLASVNANAQFEKGTQYGNTFLSGLGIGYNGTDKFNFGFGGDYGYFIQDNWMLRGGAAYQHVDEYNAFKLNLGAVPEVGYCFYLNHYISIEPSVYGDLCCNDWSNGSGFGLKVGVAVYW